MATKAWVTLGCTTLLLLSTACGGGEPAEQGAGAGATLDTARLRAVYGHIDSTYDSLMARYGPMASQLSPNERQLFASMQQMHAQASGMHGAMMGGGGMMGGRGTMGGGAMMQGGAAGGAGVGAVREWDQQMLSMHQAMAGMFQQAGEQDMASLHQRMAQLYGQALEYEPPAAAEAPSAEAVPAAPAGPTVFAQNCAACHGSEGRGVAGLFPPLAGSEWVASGPDTPIRIVLHGLQGSVQVQGQTFNGVMPAFGARLSDQELAAVLSYVRSAFGNGASAVDAGTVSTVRRADIGRGEAMTPDELR